MKREKTKSEKDFFDDIKEKFKEKKLEAKNPLVDSEKSGFVTGITVAVDGGFSAYSGV